MLSVIEWGLPGITHPFPYHMDEWHQLEFVRNVFTIGTVDKNGSTQIPMFHFILTGILVAPFQIFGYIDTSMITNAISGISEQHKLFIVLRLTTLFFGCLSIMAIALTGKKYFNANSALTALFLTITPVWLSLSNYFKYDIALVFWITLSLFFILRLKSKSDLKDYIFAGFVIACATGTKISAAPLLPLILISNILFEKRMSFRKVFCAYLAFGITFIVLAVPDIFFRLSNYVSFTTQITRDLSRANEGLILNYPLLIYIFVKQIPTSLGYPFYFLFVFSIMFQAIKSLGNFVRNKKVESSKILILAGVFFFILSIAPLKLESGSNRIIVLLPFLALLASITLNDLNTRLRRIKYLGLFVLCIIFFLQFIQSISWILMRYTPPVQEKASRFIESKYKFPTTIGIEGIPIYQLLPDIVIKNYYNSVYKVGVSKSLNFQIVEASERSLPDVVLVTNDVIFENYKTRVPKSELLDRLEKDGYKKIITFTPDTTIFKYFGNPVDYYLSGLLAEPFSTSIFQK